MTKPKYYQYRGEVPKPWPPEVIEFFGKTIFMGDPNEECSIRSLEGYYCTRKNGHHGPHVAHISRDVICEVWDQEAKDG